MRFFFQGSFLMISQKGIIYCQFLQRVLQLYASIFNAFSIKIFEICLLPFV